MKTETINQRSYCNLSIFLSEKVEMYNRYDFTHFTNDIDEGLEVLSNLNWSGNVRPAQLRV